MKKANVIILAGQSNAVGVGYNKYLPDYFDKGIVDKFYKGYGNVLINFSSHWIKSNGFVPVKTNCTERGKDTSGPELGIAKRLTELYGDDRFFIVKCAFGGSNLYNDWRSPLTGEPYSTEARVTGHGEHCGAGWCFNELISLTRESLLLLEKKGYEPEIRAFLWMQGESDACQMKTTENYISRYDCLLRDFRSTFSQYLSSCTYVDAGISKQWQFYDELNCAKRRYSEEHSYEYISTVDAGLTTTHEPHDDPDVAHYDVDSVVKLGELFADRIKI